MGRKDHLARGFDFLRLSGVCRLVRQAISRELPILAYHRVLDMGLEDSFPFDPELVSASVADFKWQMEFIRDRYDPISFHTVLDWIAGNAELPQRPIIVTFDDGYDDNFYHAFPILRSLGIPATIFVSTGYVGTSEPFWFDFVAHVIWRAPDGLFYSGDLGLDVPLCGDIESRRVGAAKVVRALKAVSNQRRLRYLDELADRYGGTDSPARALSRPLNWAQVREMSEAGIEFGSHSVTHPILSRLEEEDLVRELGDSRAVLESMLGKDIEVIAYPVGGHNEFDEKVVRFAERAGYKLGVSYLPGVNCLDRLDNFQLRRHHVERSTTPQYFSALLSLPEVFSH
jgi:peptidoglycan/xylan/chitin deacetylase (PgdA/CDA1 family)